MARATFGFLTCLAIACVAGVWLRSESAGQAESFDAPVSHLSNPEPGTPYAIDCRHGVATIALPAHASGRYALVIGSLGNPEREFSVTVDDAPHGSRLAASTRVFPMSPPPYEAERKGKAPERPRMPVSSEQQDVTKRNSSAHLFFLHDGHGRLNDPANYIPITTSEIARGTHVRVLLDRKTAVDPRLSKTAAEIVRLFEQEIRPESQRLFGPRVDLDGDGRVSIVLTPHLNRLQTGDTPLDGLVRPSDFRPGLPRPFSNQCDVLFLNTRLLSGPHLKAVLAHEYTHVVCFSRRLAVRPDAPLEDDWLSEGISHVAEQLHHGGLSNLRDRIRAYQESPQSYPLVIADYHAAGLWRNAGCRGATYRFLQWCVDRFGVEMVRRLIDASEVGVANIELATGVPFETLFREWSLSLLDLGKIRRLQCPRTKPLTFAVRGTAIAIVNVDCLPGKGRRLQIRSERDARLQITLIRLPEPKSAPNVPRMTRGTNGADRYASED